MLFTKTSKHLLIGVCSKGLARLEQLTPESNTQCVPAKLCLRS